MNSHVHPVMAAALNAHVAPLARIEAGSSALDRLQTSPNSQWGNP